MPVLSTLQRQRYFGEIRGELGAITDRALSQSLKAMEARKWVERRIIEPARPPRSIYRAINEGEAISQIAAASLVV